MDTRSQLVAFARQIAVYRGYTNLVNGLQPLAVLRAKRATEQEELADAMASKTPLHVLHEAADMLYYSACIAELWIDAEWSETEDYLAFLGVDVQKAEQAALAKYGWRAERAGNKDESYELHLIEEAVDALDSREDVESHYTGGE